LKTVGGCRCHLRAVKLGGDAYHQLAGFVVGQAQPAAVEAVERDDRGEIPSVVLI